MLSFTAGLVAGCIIGVMIAFCFLLFAHAIPDGFPPAPKKIFPAWQFSAAVMIVMLVATLLYGYFRPHRLSFIALALLFLVFLTAKARGMLAALPTLAVAAILMSYVLPPANTIWIATLRDRVLLAVFILFGAIVSRLVGRHPETL